MPSKSSSFSFHKLRGFHLKRLTKHKSQASTSSKVLNASTPFSHLDLQRSDEREAPVGVTAPPCQIEYPSSEIRKKPEPHDISQIQGTKVKEGRSFETNLWDNKKATSKRSFKHFCTTSFKHLNYPCSHGENASSSDEDHVIEGNDKNTSSVRNLFVKNIGKQTEKKIVNKIISLPNSLTIEAIKYRCKILQLHNTQCGCSSPRLHIYLTTNHRCSDKCFAELYSTFENISTSSSESNPINRYIFAIMRGKSRARKFSKKKTNKSIADHVSTQDVNVQQGKGCKRRIGGNNIQNDEPESELLGEVCESLPTIMNTLSGDVEYIVLDDDTFNLSNGTKNVNSQGAVTTKTTTHSFEQDEDVKPDIHSLQTASTLTNEGKNWEEFLQRCLSEVSYQSNTTKNVNQCHDENKIKVEQVEENTSEVSETTGLAGACTNHSPSIKDIFGDVSIKDEPLDAIDANDMSVDDFSQEIKKLTDSDHKPNDNSGNWPISQVASLQEISTNKGLFAGLIKEETKASEDNKGEILNVNVGIKEENTNNDESKEGDDYSSDDSLGPLQIDEGDQQLPAADSGIKVSNIPPIPVPVAANTSQIILPSVNIISPFKIKIFFGTPHNVQLEKPHDLFNTSNIRSPASGTSNTLQSFGLATRETNKQNAMTIDEEESETDTLQNFVGNESNMPSLKCIYCQTVSPNIQALAKHFEDHQKDGLIICYFCQKSFGDKTGMKRHMRTHTGEKPYQCKVCGKRFSLPGNFKKHRDIHEDIRTEPCEICGKTFRRKEHLKYHMRTHTGEKPYTCTECGTSFTARYSLQIHMNIHLGKKPYKCTYCTKAFSDKSTMRKHVRVHTGEKPFHCEKCGRCFGESGTLAAHMATHRSDRPFKCKLCPLSFKTTGGLRQHEKIHTGEKQYACKYCGVKFLQKYNMTMHERIHTGEKPYACNDCHRSFRSRSCLAKHVVLHGGEEERRYECEHCNSRFYRKAHLRRHIDMHLGIKNYECEICAKKFCARGTLENHQKTFHTQGARRFPCNWCGRVFKRQVYVNTHECIRDPVKVEKYKQEMKALAASNKSPPINPENDSSSDTEYSSIEIKSEPEDDTFEEDEEEEEEEKEDGLGEIDSVIGNADFDTDDNSIKVDPS